MQYSVIIPVYNAEATLKCCLDSLINQQFSDYEIILINDGSADSSDGICREYADKYPQIKYYVKENGGVSSARNLGLDRARGEYVLFVDSDDYVAENYFQTIDNVLSGQKPDMLLFGYRNFGGTTSEWSIGSYWETEEAAIAAQIASALYRYLFSSLWSKAFKRELIKRNRLRFDETLSIGEDQLFIFAYSMDIHSLMSIQNTLYYVDTSGNESLSRKRRDYLTEQLIQVNRKMMSVLQGSHHSEKVHNIYVSALAWTAYRSVYSCCRELLKYDYTAGQRRREIKKICRLYRNEKIRPRGLKCRVIALPVQLGWSGVLDFLINRKA